MLSNQETKELKQFAAEIRIHTIRQMAARGFGHMGGAMSICDLLSVLYGKQMNYDARNPEWEGRDWLICSKGHAGPAVYAALALKGFFPMEWLKTLNQPGTRLPSHCDHLKTPGIDVTTGSLGQGLSVAAGIALAKKIDGKENTVYCIIGDGESQEGQNWEAAMFAAQQRLDNLILFVDNNRQQLDNRTDAICSMESLKEKFESFRWETREVCGHDVEAVNEAIRQAKHDGGRPHAIVLNTIKGKGCTFAENQLKNHHINVTKDQAAEALKALKNG
ncbi:MAG: transketolase [Dorea sp.]|jgi:transketolase|nr:transketolase [Dorea sp.]